MKDERLQREINKNIEPAYMTKKSQIVDYFRQEYAGKPNSAWTGKAAAIIAGTSDKSSREYKSAIRQFQGDRLHKEATKSAGQFVKLGQALPSIGIKPKNSTITITVKGNQAVMRGPRVVGSRERVIDVTMSGSQAYDFVNNPSYEAVYDEYGVDPDLFLEGDYELEVSGVSIG